MTPFTGFALGMAGQGHTSRRSREAEALSSRNFGTTMANLELNLQHIVSDDLLLCLNDVGPGPKLRLSQRFRLLLVHAS